MAHYDIFRQELATKYPAYGHALWEPNPGNLYPAVEIGDVGFIRQGKFHRLFNALLPGDHPSQIFGVPEHHEPLQLNLPQHIDTGTLSPNNFRSVEVTVTSGGAGVFALGPEPEQISFSCPRQGAILSLPLPARRHDTLAQGDFGKWIVTHIDLWFAFTRRLGLGITRMEDIVLVTGCHLARSWTNIAFLQGREEERVSFGVQVSGVSGVEWQFPHEDRQGMALNLGPSGQDLPEDQCIFIRGFRVTRFLGILPRLRGAAEPGQDPLGDDPDAQLMKIPADTNDPLHALLEYISTQAPDCDMALVHDDDLMRIDNVLDTVIDHLQSSMPKIWQVQCEGGSEAKTPTVKVATLSKNPFGTPSNLSQLFPGPASNSQPLFDAAGNQYSHRTATEIASHPLTETHVDHDLIDRLLTVFGKPGQSSHVPQDGHQEAWPLNQIGPSASFGIYSDAMKVSAQDSRRLLREASEDGNMQRVLILLDRGADVTAFDDGGWTPLHRAVWKGHARVARVLLQYGADTAARNYQGRAPLHLASSEGHLNATRVLIYGGADTMALDSDQLSPLHLAVCKGHAEVALVLLEHGADATAPDRQGRTPLQLAASHGYLEVTRVLLHRGAGVAVQDKDGWTPLHRAALQGHAEVARALLERGADVTARDREGRTPLHLASSLGHLEAIRVLLDCGVDTTVKDEDGKTALDHASSTEVAVLLRRGADETAQVKGVTK